MSIAPGPHRTFAYWVVYYRNRKCEKWELLCRTWFVRHSAHHKRPWGGVLRRGKPLLFLTRKEAREHATHFREYPCMEVSVRKSLIHKVPMCIPEKP